MKTFSDGYLPYDTPRLRFNSSNWGHFGPAIDIESEFPENPTRSIEIAKKLQTVVNNPVAGSALAITCDFALSSAEGDEFGIVVEVDDRYPQRSSKRIVSIVESALSGFDLEDYWQIIWRFLAWGDCFVNVTVEGDKLTPLLLPTWQIHLEVDDLTGKVTKAYQLRPGIDDKRTIDLETFYQWSYRKRFIYGRSIYYEVKDTADFYQQNSEDIAISSRTAALVPTVHTMPEGTDSAYLQDYKSDHKQQLRAGPVSDIYLPFGGRVEKSFVADNQLGAMVNALNLRRLEIAVASRVPLYLLGVEYKSAREISLQPAMTFRHHIGRVRAILASGLRRIIDPYLKSKGFSPPYPYMLKFPKINLNPFDPDQDMEGTLDTSD